MPGGGLIRIGGLAAAGGGALFVAHGAVMMLADENLDAPPYALPLIALGLVGLCASLRGGGGWPGRGGCLLAYAALAVSLVQLVALLLMRWREEPFWSVHAPGLAVSLLLVLVATLLLGVAALRTATFRAGWRIVPLAVGLLWLPLLLGGEWVGDRLSPAREISLGFVPTGLTWILLGAALVLGTTASAAHPAAPGASAPPPRSA
jgi:hypothetical protein